MPETFLATLTAIGLVVVLIWAIVLSIVFLRIYRAYQKFTKGVTKKNLKNVLNELVDSLKTAGDEIKSLQTEVTEIETTAKSHLQKVGFIRFNPFADTGGNQSFCLCLLDDHNDGIVITSLHSRDQTRIYTKPISAGKAKGQELSKEEQEAIKQAQSKKR